MIKLVEEDKRWEIEVEVGNDWGEPSYLEIRNYFTKEDMEEALENMNYYDYPQSVKEVVEYKVEYIFNEEY